MVWQGIRRMFNKASSYHFNNFLNINLIFFCAIQFGGETNAYCACTLFMIVAVDVDIIEFIDVVEK